MLDRNQEDRLRKTEGKQEGILERVLKSALQNLYYRTSIVAYYSVNPSSLNCEV